MLLETDLSKLMNLYDISMSGILCDWEWMAHF